MEGTGLLNKVKGFIVENSLVEKGEKIIVAVSGGPDSVFLLHILFSLQKEFCLDLLIGHFSHGLRPKEDPFEESLVRELSQKMGLNLIVGRPKVPLLASKGSLEQNAREERYRFLLQILKETSFHKVALGHTMDDQAETFIIRLLRGSGHLGLSGMRPKNNVFIRPLLGVSKAEIQRYLDEGGIPYRLDSSNLDKRFLRNRIRLELIPILRGYQPRIIEVLARTCQILGMESDFLNQVLEDWLAMALIKEGHGVKVKREYLSRLSLEAQTFVLRRILEIAMDGPKGIGYKHIIQMRNLLSSQGKSPKISLPKDLFAAVEGDVLIIAPKITPDDIEFSYPFHRPGHYELTHPPISVRIQEMEHLHLQDIKANKDPYRAYFDLEKVSYPILVRNPKPGDRFCPLGMKGSKKLQDLFVDNKVPREQRKLVPVFLTRERIMWVCGYRIDEGFKVRQDTRKVLEIQVNKKALEP